MMALPPLGLLVFGDNHLLLRGPQPDRAAARQLAGIWMLPNIGATIDRSGIQGPWRISTREIREEIAWAIVLPSDMQVQPAVAQLLDEVAARGIPIRHAASEDWPGLTWTQPRR